MSAAAGRRDLVVLLFELRAGEPDMAPNGSRFKLRGAAAAIKTDSLLIKRPPRPVSFKRWLGRTHTVFDQGGAYLRPSPALA